MRRERFLLAMIEVDLMRAIDFIIKESSRVDALRGPTR